MTAASTTASDPRPPAMRGLVPALGWACFLGCSWTWVIGMLLPILLVRDYGLWGWIVFAIPNVVGAAAMGFVLVTPSHSRALLRKHREAALRFSEITVAYHVFAVGWAYHRLFDNWGLLAVAAALLVTLLLTRRREALLIGAVVLAAASVAAFNLWSGMHGIALRLPEDTRLTGLELLLFAPAALVGFALCPYLDLTFHRARQETTAGTGRVAFVVGFCVVFAVMITFSLWYAHELRGVFEPGGTLMLQGPLLAVLMVHLTLQAGFTTALHVREVATRRGHAGLHRLFMLAVAGGALAWWAVSEPMTLYYGLSVGEVVYRAFLLFYGLVFPAYVFLCMIPTLRRRPPVDWWPRLATCFAAILVAAPMAYAGFVMGVAGWIVAALGVLVVARGVIELALPRDEPGPERPAR